ncbi:hypothetical protein Sta7437_1200 [Stanieria cyanosphaera PCC 7437]|uniref:Methionine synthase n=1 Tax=Stanieria cyanosphaera (strain ATCC 29371 / PCC 7437) TaxID=111780 RepID=K9XQ72_STAC7|nr:Npun_R2821/Npun_R2822 family protein [Stanieria cyanosphaera]AFZ34770.1 hypothetical protein Sta7437_1200 [Stanieria cyanosphaera PCC 7437]
MNRGIYITANDKVTDQAIALLNSIRLYDSDTPVVLIPYDENYTQIAEILGKSHGVTVYQDLQLIEDLSQQLYNIFGQGFFDKPNKLRKHACWFGEFDEFLYIDTDIVVFEKIIDNLKYLSDYDFLCCDYQHKSGIKNVFSSKIIEAQVIQPNEIQDTFNSGFWATKKGLITQSEIQNIFAECAAHPEYFDFSQKVSDQPIFNYMVLTRIKKRFNLVRREGKAPGSWAGSPHFKIKDHVLFDPATNQSLQYLHWAGIKIQPGCPYWDIWNYYRYLGETNPPADFPVNNYNPTQFQKFLQGIKTKFSF